MQTPLAKKILFVSTLVVLCVIAIGMPRQVRQTSRAVSTEVPLISETGSDLTLRREDSAHAYFTLRKPSHVVVYKTNGTKAGTSPILTIPSTRETILTENGAFYQDPQGVYKFINLAGASFELKQLVSGASQAYYQGECLEGSGQGLLITDFLTQGNEHRLELYLSEGTAATTRRIIGWQQYGDNNSIEKLYCIKGSNELWIEHTQVETGAQKLTRVNLSSLSSVTIEVGELYLPQNLDTDYEVVGDYLLRLRSVEPEIYHVSSNSVRQVALEPLGGTTTLRGIYAFNNSLIGHYWVNGSYSAVFRLDNELRRSSLLFEDSSLKIDYLSVLDDKHLLAEYSKNNALLRKVIRDDGMSYATNGYKIFFRDNSLLLTGGVDPAILYYEDYDTKSSSPFSLKPVALLSPGSNYFARGISSTANSGESLRVNNQGFFQVIGEGTIKLYSMPLVRTLTSPPGGGSIPVMKRKITPKLIPPPPSSITVDGSKLRVTFYKALEKKAMYKLACAISKNGKKLKSFKPTSQMKTTKPNVTLRKLKSQAVYFCSYSMIANKVESKRSNLFKIKAS